MEDNTNNNQIIDFEEIFKNEEHYNSKNSPVNHLKDTERNLLTILIYAVLFFLGIAGLITSFIVLKVSPKTVDYVTLSRLQDTKNYNNTAIVTLDGYLNEIDNFKKVTPSYFILDTQIEGKQLALVTFNINTDDLTFIQTNKELIASGQIKAFPGTEGVKERALNVYYSNYSNLIELYKNNSNFINAGSYTNLKSSLVQFFSYLLVFIPLVIINFRPLKDDYAYFVKDKTSSVPGKLLTGFAYMLAATFALGIITGILSSLFKTETISANQSFIEDLMNSKGFIFMAFSVVVFAPVVEELVFRKAIFGLFKNDKTAITVSSLSFGLLHVTTEIINLIAGGSFNFVNLLNVLVLAIPYVGIGVFLGYWYSKNNRNISLLIGMHAISNLVSVIGILL